ncbi:MAG TPA: hypothetical protein VJK51_05570 [Candidatus Nanoarchaeia archaeon]|nr:hypothetical protein [Candidatus Nanoarchaeia archaeon]
MAEKRKNKDWTDRLHLRSAQEKLEEGRDRTEEFIEQHPWKSIAISAAVGAGVALGAAILFGGRKKRSMWDRLFSYF